MTTVVLTFQAGRIATRTVVPPDSPVPSRVLEGLAPSPVGLFGWPWRH